MELAQVQRIIFLKHTLKRFKYQRFIFIQLVVVMSTVLVVCNVLILLDSAPAMLVTRVQNVILLVVVTLLVQAALYVISQQVNVPAILETQEPHVIPVTPTTTEQVLDFAQVRILLCHHMPYVLSTF